MREVPACRGRMHWPVDAFTITAFIYRPEFPMSKILALDTSTDACSAALLLDGQLLKRFKVEPRRHTHLLLPMVDELLQEAGVALKRLDAIAFGRGPGSFAGIRIATGAAQGLALAAGLPVIPVSTLECMATEHLLASGAADMHLLTALDARMDEVYWCAWEACDGKLSRLTPERVGAPADMQVDGLNSGFAALGSGWRYADGMPAELVAAAADPLIELYPNAATMALIAAEAFARGETVVPDEVQPVYLRDQVAWKKKDQQ